MEVADETSSKENHDDKNYGQEDRESPAPERSNSNCPFALAERVVPAVGRYCGCSSCATHVPPGSVTGLSKSVHDFLGTGVADKSELRPGKPDQSVFRLRGEQRVNGPACGIQRAGTNHRVRIDYWHGDHHAARTVSLGH